MFEDDETTEAHERRITRCRAQDCRRRIVWLKTAAGKRMPVEADTVEPEDELFDPARHESHFATFPAAGQFRRRGS